MPDLISTQEPEHLAEVGVAVLAGGQLLGEGERLVRCRRQQQHPSRSVVEQLPCELRTFSAVRVEQFPESLELVQDDQVGFEYLDAGCGERRPQVTDQRAGALTQ